jgi:hypothetical protein
MQADATAANATTLRGGQVEDVLIEAGGSQAWLKTSPATW